MKKAKCLIKNTPLKITQFIKDNKTELKIYATVILLFLVLSTVNTVFAAGNATNTTQFDNMIDFILGWVKKAGAVVAIVGGIQFGLGLKNDNPDSKHTGTLTIVAGGIVWAIGAGGKNLMA